MNDMLLAQVESAVLSAFVDRKIVYAPVGTEDLGAKKYKGYISPSQLKFGTGLMAARAAFPPAVLEDNGIEEYPSASTYPQKTYFTFGLGTFVHAWLLPSIVDYLNERGYAARCEVPVRYWATEGTADLIIKDAGKIYIIDLKTNFGQKVHTNINATYRRQLYFYSRCLQDMFPSAEVVSGHIVYLTVAQDPLIVSVSFSELANEFKSYFKEANKETVRLAKLTGYSPAWVLSDNPRDDKFKRRYKAQAIAYSK